MNDTGQQQSNPAIATLAADAAASGAFQGQAAVLNPSQYPYDTVVLITDVIGGEGVQGSGVLISPDEVLTASHVVYSATYGTASDITVTPGYNAGVSPFGSASGTYIHYFQIQDANDSISANQSQYDYAVIHLSQPFAGLGAMGLAANFPGGNVNVTGYPGYLGGELASNQEFVTDDPYYSLLDGTSIGSGSSGGPVWTTSSSGSPEVVGVVSSAQGGVGSAAYFTQITGSALSQIEAWVQQDDGSSPTPAPAPSPIVVSITLQGSHSQYEIARDPSSGQVTVADTVANRDGSQTVQNLQEIDFTDGTGVIDPTANAAQVARLYQAALDRAPDLGGLDTWTAQLNAGTLNLDRVALAFINSAEFQAKYGSLGNAQFVVQLYQNALNRNPDQNGEQYWIGQLDHGQSRAQVLIGVADSTEAQLDTLGTIGDPDMDEVYRLYVAGLGRTPDTAGLSYWTQQLESGAAPLQVAQGFVASSEFTALVSGLNNQGFVDLLYQDALHRAPDAAGEQDWVGQLNAGASKAQVLLAFSDSPESRLDTSLATHDGWVYAPGATS